jgi:hypothetical protein
MDRKILDKIKKCLRLAQSSNAHEAAAAMRQAQKLMQLHGVSTDDVVISEVESFTVKSGAGQIPPAHLCMLANMVDKAFGAESVYSCGRHASRWVGRFEFFGANGTAEVAGYAYEVLARQLTRDRNAYLETLNKRIKRSTKVRRGDLYAQGWVNAVAKHVVPHQRTEAEERSIELYKAKRWPTPLEERQGRDNTKGIRSHDYGGSRQAAIGEVSS